MTRRGTRPGVEHLEQVFVLQRLGGFPERDQRFLSGRELLVQGGEAFVVARRFAHEDRLAGEIIKARNLRRSRPCHNDLADIAEACDREVHQFPALGRNGDIAGRYVTLACNEPGQQLVARLRDEYHSHLQVLVLELLSSSSNN